MTRSVWPRARILAFRGRSEQWQCLCTYRFLMFQCLTYRSCKRLLRRSDRSLRCSISRSCPRGRRLPTGAQCRPNPPDLEHGMSGQGSRRSSIASARLERACTSARALHPRAWPRPPERETTVSPPGKDANLARAAAVSWGEIDTARPAQLTCGDSLPSGTPRVSLNSLCRRINVLSRPDRPIPPAATRPRRSPYARVHGRHGYSRRAPHPRARTPRLATRCPCPLRPAR
jgi:hypothetical protein